ncbi:hypothetical protein Sinac_2491 [Singulisphaera acidiphila DSM 18658]|uniref:Uncharacterized protein n=1 Tax=Singulisphaera acidiphila (strain ATCC BAA-1392 / DSM 18658 / VKM B-2454 / MOB10) TaxID=886293 RepID=L0DD64_SINAD|nr:hypothetical protein Sinac_2491 [Singulisphaera acidiphila DSM 18658]
MAFSPSRLNPFHPSPTPQSSRAGVSERISRASCLILLNPFRRIRRNLADIGARTDPLRCLVGRRKARFSTQVSVIRGMHNNRLRLATGVAMTRRSLRRRTRGHLGGVNAVSLLDHHGFKPVEPTTAIPYGLTMRLIPFAFPPKFRKEVNSRYITTFPELLSSVSRLPGGPELDFTSFSELWAASSREGRLQGARC